MEKSKRVEHYLDRIAQAEENYNIHCERPMTSKKVAANKAMLELDTIQYDVLNDVNIHVDPHESSNRKKIRLFREDEIYLTEQIIELRKRLL